MPDSISKALDGKRGKGKGAKLHTHAVKYERAHNGGFHAHVARHTEDGAHHHDEHHVLADADAAAQHLQDHMGDQPAMGQQESPAMVAPPEPEGGAAGADAGAAPGAGM